MHMIFDDRIQKGIFIFVSDEDVLYSRYIQIIN